ncbi:MAG: aminotransferase class I/II-fold pyridoxal phosphate-dependent enzyme [Proteobacteria bacterium]|nr:aminotransferase class I/II-fold pyridoxal phosphate-dependent enzyme [Pseudomonadota bacterium]
MTARTGVRFGARTAAIATPGSRAWQVSDRAEARLAAGDDVIVLTVGDVDVPTPAHILAAVQRSLAAGRTHYAPIVGEPALREAVAARTNHRYGTRYGSEQVVIFPGAQSALFSSIQCLAGPGEEVVVLEPFYATYEAVVAAAGAVPVAVSLRQGQAFGLDLAALERAVTPATRAVLLNTPNNPAGFVLGADEVGALARLCARLGLWLVCDEVYAEIAYARAHASPACEPAILDRLVLVDSLSKSHAMTGWRIGWAIGPPDLAAHLGRLAMASLFGSPTFIQDAAVAALTGPQDICAELRQLYRERSDALLHSLAGAPGLHIWAPQGGMFVLAEISATGLAADAFATRLLEEAGVAVVPGLAFGQSVADCIRLGLTQPAERLAEAGARIRRWLAAR